MASAASGAFAGTYYVDAGNPNCSVLGPGTESRPYCSISAAIAAHATAGTTILVKPGLYREQVTIRGSGASGTPLTLRATGPGVIVEGTDDFSHPSLWVQVPGSAAWRAASVEFAPRQVFVDGERLERQIDTTRAPALGAFVWTHAQHLVVNLNGVNPGTRTTLVGIRPYGFHMVTRSWITIEGFEVLRTDDSGIHVQINCADIQVLRNRATFCGRSGVQLIGGHDILVQGNIIGDNGLHGVSVTSGAHDCTFRDNESYGSSDPETRRAVGFYFYQATHHRLERNRAHDNQDSGFHFAPGAHFNVSINNRSWNNGDHGFDHLDAIGSVHVNDVAFGNFKDGFSIEGGSKGTHLHNVISVNNGLTTHEFDLWLEAASDSGFTSDDNLFWNSDNVQEPFKHGLNRYLQIADWRTATGQDAHSLQSDPLFVAPDQGDFRVEAGSPAIDSGNSGTPFWSSTDAAGHPRVDAPGVANTGTGPIAYADRGALEYQHAAPVARLVVTPNAGSAPLHVTADASTSSDVDGPLASYRFDFGDGTVVGPQGGATASHTLAAGRYTVTVTVKDQDGMTAQAGVTLSVTDGSVVDNRPLVFPNPVSETGSLRFSIQAAAPLKVEIYDVTGRVVRTLADLPAATPGLYEYALDDLDDHGRRTGAGVYFYRIVSGSTRITGRFLSVR